MAENYNIWIFASSQVLWQNGAANSICYPSEKYSWDFDAPEGKPLSAQGHFKQEEYIVAIIGGLGLTAAIVGAAMMVMDVQADNARIAVYAGLVVILGAVALWLVLLKPWLEFDDLKTPYFTGHHHDHHEEPHEEGHGEGLATSSPAEVVLAAAQSAQASHDSHSQPKAPPVAPEPKATTADDLTLIEGVGDKIAAALHQAGITSFAHIAAKTPTELETAVKAQNVDLVGDAKTWPRQAKLAAAGDANGLEDLKRRVKEGKVLDDLTILEGIGPKIQQILRDHGIITFADLAEADVENLTKILRTAKLPTIPDTWPKQAEYLVRGDLSGFEHYKGQLKGGREASSD
ncbi:MAG: hypothetical protein HY862_08425 [Chloroflexi bacterium]|nr:hypothetical protein [Chloroflexota bacterium]